MRDVRRLLAGTTLSAVRALIDKNRVRTSGRAREPARARVGSLRRFARNAAAPRARRRRTNDGERSNDGGGGDTRSSEFFIFRARGAQTSARRARAGPDGRFVRPLGFRDRVRRVRSEAIESVASVRETDGTPDAPRSGRERETRDDGRVVAAAAGRARRCRAAVARVHRRGVDSSLRRERGGLGA